jgi:hypothetical protein
MSAAAVVVSTTVWSFTKSALFPVVALAAVFLLVSMVKPRGRPLRGAVAAALVLVSVWGLAANSRSDKTWKRNANEGLTQFNLNFANLLRLEILNDPSDTAWFVSHGMPDPSGLVAYRRSNPDDAGWLEGEESFIQSYLARADPTAWGNTKGRGVYAEYVLTHAPKVVARFSRELPYMLVPPRSELLYATGSRSVLPGAAESLLFDTTPAVTGVLVPPAAFGDVALLVAACLVLAFVPRRRARDHRLLVTAGATFLLSLLAIGVAWLLSPVELVRHAIPASVLLRLSLWLTAFGLLDAVVRGSSRESAVER